MISKEDVIQLAELSRIELTEAEIESLQKDISSILEYVGQVSSVEGSAEKEVGLNHNVMRDDVPYEENSMLKAARETIVDAFPKRKEDFNVVRKIIQKDE
ncbi:MAG TPA: Asp-tRNA(Asn)/Glu-tRNA(Gln) amidotransferase subunit GatC [Candidatus Paceibacterota bacterium]|nr:Asp-tRNA(Asn)/Glu-tRNA(Gln) amidotransferase subunit GatC [Candidatus Paceibacterota bacterium]